MSTSSEKTQTIKSTKIQIPPVRRRQRNKLMKTLKKNEILEIRRLLSFICKDAELLETVSLNKLTALKLSIQTLA